MRGIVLVLIGVFVQFITQAAFAQDSVVLISPTEAVQIALNQNQQIALAKRDEQIAASLYKQTEAVFLPQVNFSYTAFSTNNPLNAFGFKLQQQLIEQSDFSPASLNHPSGTPDFMTQLSVQQPVLNLDMLYQRKSALKQTAVYHFKSERTRAYIALHVEQACLQISLDYEAEKVISEGLQAAQALYKFTKDHFDQGLLQKSDLLQAAVQVKNLESALQESRLNVKNASDNLGLLMNRAPGIIYKMEGVEPLQHVNDSDTVPSSRADFKAMEAGIQAYDLLLKSGRMSYLPKLNAFGNYQLHDKRMFGFGGNGWLVGMQLSLDIFRGNQTKNKLATQTLERNKLSDQLEIQKSESRVEINKTQRQYESAGEKIAAQQSAIEYATEWLRIIEDRYKQGLVNTTDVLNAQTSLSQQKLGLAQAIFSQRTAVSYLRFLTNPAN